MKNKEFGQPSVEVEALKEGKFTPDGIRKQIVLYEEAIAEFDEENILKEAANKSGIPVEKIRGVAEKSGILKNARDRFRQLKQSLGALTLMGATLIVFGVGNVEAQIGKSDKTDDETNVVAAEKIQRNENPVEYDMSKLKRAPVVEEKGMSATTMGTDFEQEDQALERKTYGATEANFWVDQLGLNKDPAVLQNAMDHYYLNCPEGTTDRWGDGWLNKFVLNDFMISAHNLRDQLSQSQEEQIETILADAVREETFFVDSTCGIDTGNSCSEDFISYLTIISKIKNWYPNVAQRVGIDYLNKLEQKYLKLTFTTENNFFSLVREQTEDGTHVLMHNHHGQNAVYSGVLMMYLNQAMSAYSQSGNKIPNWYNENWLKNNIKDMFGWIQSVSTSDGSSYLNACRGTDGNMYSCADVGTANAIPKVIPAGRLINNLISSGMLSADSMRSGDYDFRLFDETYHGGNIDNKGRQEDYNVSNSDNVTFVHDEVARVIRRHLGR